MEEYNADIIALLKKEKNDYIHIFKKEDKKKDSEIENLTCKTCFKVFSNKSNLFKHVNRIHKKIGYRCEYENCGKVYSDKHFLKIHITKNHLEQKLYQCRYCDRGYTYKLTFMAHLRESHLQIYPYLCIVKDCLATFSIKRKMVNHIRLHHKELVKELISILNENKEINK